MAGCFLGGSSAKHALQLTPSHPQPLPNTRELSAQLAAASRAPPLCGAAVEFGFDSKFKR